MFLGRGVLKICSKFTGEHSCQSAISIKLLRNFIEVQLRHECSPVHLLHIFRTPFPKTPLGDCFCVLLKHNQNSNEISEDLVVQDQVIRFLTLRFFASNAFINYHFRCFSPFALLFEPPALFYGHSQTTYSIKCNCKMYKMLCKLNISIRKLSLHMICYLHFQLK